MQGESKWTGLPTVFVRLTGCPLRCNYCDTEYAFHGGEKKSLDDIVTRIASYQTPYVTVTGGEPLAQPECLELLDTLVNNDYRVSLETSGALDISMVNPQVVKIMDLKTPSSGEIARNRYQNIDYLSVEDQVKFVINGDDDYRWAKQTLSEHGLSDRCEVLFSPCVPAQDATELADKILADRLPVRFQIQLHKLLWGDTPGK